MAKFRKNVDGSGIVKVSTEELDTIPLKVLTLHDGVYGEIWREKIGATRVLIQQLRISQSVYLLEVEG